MSRRGKRYLRATIFVVIILLISFVLLGIARILVSSGVGVVKETEYMTEEVIETEKEVVVVGLEDEEIPKYEMDSKSEVVRLEGSEAYDGVVNQIVMSVGNVFSSIDTDSIAYDYTSIKTYGLIKNESLGFIDEDSFLEGNSSFFIENSLTVIGMFDNRYVVCVYNYDEGGKELVVIDYEDIEVYQEQEYTISLGSEISVRGCVGQYLVRSLSGYDVMYLKG